MMIKQYSSATTTLLLLFGVLNLTLSYVPVVDKGTHLTIQNLVLYLLPNAIKHLRNISIIFGADFMIGHPEIVG